MTQYEYKYSLLETSSFSLSESTTESDESAGVIVLVFLFGADLHLWDMLFWEETAELES